MTVYLRIYSETSDTYASYTNADYPTARAGTQSTAGGVAITAAASVRNYFSGSTYIVAQSFFVFNTSALTAPPSGGAFSISVSTFGGNPDADTLRIRQVSSISNKIAGAALSGHTPIFANPGTFPTTTGRYSLPVINASLIPATTAFQVCLHTVGNENGTVPTGATGFSVNFADQTGTTSDPYLDLVGGWSFVGISNPVVVATTGHTLTEPAGVAAGDLLIATFSTRIASTTSMTLASGWTLVGEAKNNNVLTTSSALPTGVMAYIVRGASAPALTFTHPVAPSQSIGRIIAYRGSAQTTPLDAFTAVTTATAQTAVSVAGLTTTQDDDLIVAMAAGGQEAAWSSFTNVTTPLTASGATDTTTALSTTAWIERADSLDTSGADGSLAIFDAIRTTTGATGNLTVTASVSAGHVVIAGAFKTASSVTPVPVTVSVTGQEVTAAVGEVTVSLPAVVSITVDAAGQAVTSAVGDPSVTGKSSFIAPGQAVTSAVGPLALIVTHARFTVTAPEMIAGTQGVGVSAGGSISTTASGSEITSNAGQVSVKADHRFSVIGQQVAGSVGEVAVTAKANVNTLVAGQATTAGVGQVTVDARASVSTTATGQQVVSAVGDVSISSVVRIDASVTATGQEITTAVGQPTVTGKANVSTLSIGQAVTTAVGTPTVTGQIGVSTLLAGQELVSAVGVPAITTHARFTVTGQAVTSAVGQVGVSSGTGVTVVVGGSASPTLPAYRSHTLSSYALRPAGLNFDKPAGTVENDVMLATVVCITSGAALNDMVAPAGWTKIGTSTVVTAVSLSAKLEVWWKRAGSSEPATYFFDVYGGSQNQYGIISYSGCPTGGDPIDAFSTNSANTGATATGTGVTTTQAQDNLIWIGHNWDGTGTLTPPSGMTERADSLLYISEQAITSAGATGNRTQTLASSNPWAVYLLSLKGASGAAAFPGLSTSVSPPAAVTGQANLILAGQEVTAAGRGVSVSAGGSVSTTVSSGVVTPAVGQVGVKAEHRFAITGTQADTAVGQVSVTAKQTVSTTVVGQSLAVALSPVTVTAGSRVSVSLAGQQVASAVGTVNFSLAISALVPVVGSEIAAGVGSIYFPTGLDDAVTLGGQSVQAEVGAVTVTTVALRGMDVWTGTSWAGKPAKVWTGSAWVPKPVKLWNGSSWQ